MTDEYLIAFSSFYKAAYAQEKLAEAGIRTIAKRLPPEVIHSCGYALYLKASNMLIEHVISILELNEIGHRGIFIVNDQNSRNAYNRIN